MGTGGRRTYVIAIRGQAGPATVEEVQSGRVALLESLIDAPAQIERWLRDGLQEAETPAAEAAGR